MFYLLLEVGVAFALLIFGVTQFVIPVINDEPLMPMFNWRRRRLHGQIKETNEAIEDEGLRQKLKTLQAEAEKKRAENEEADGSGNFAA